MRPSDVHLDTIVAPATPAGRSAIAVVRLSGTDARRILGALSPGLPGTLRSRRPCLVSIRDAAGELIDSGLVTFYAGPASVTGEDVAELSVHGSPAVVERIVAAAVAFGARPAKAGEFTERAFRAGKIDLVRAEAVRELIDAKTTAAARFSARRLEGALSRKLDAVRDDLLFAAAALSATVDFAEDVGSEVDPSVTVRLEAASGELARLAATYRTGKLLAGGCRVVILGRPNAGKSTLFNALVGTARAIVTDIPGTTRDALEALVDVRGIPVTVVDTAGLRESQEPVEKIGVARAREEAARADAILYVFDGADAFSEDDRHALSGIPGTPRIFVANKSDRGTARGGSPPEEAVPFCGLDPDAGPKLSALIADLIARDIRTEETSEVLGSLRQRDLVERAREAVERTLAALADGHSPEYAVTHCHAALDALADLVGETTSEDVLARLFSTFCIGK
jgi:tRNA modification GTPase